jgi:hypothetical protein
MCNKVITGIDTMLSPRQHVIVSCIKVMRPAAMCHMFIRYMS